MTITIDLLSWLQHDKDTSDPRVSLALLAGAFFVLNFLFLLTYLTIIYPYFYSPFRHLPRPKVPTTNPTIRLRQMLINRRAKSLSWANTQIPTPNPSAQHTSNGFSQRPTRA